MTPGALNEERLHRRPSPVEGHVQRRRRVVVIGAGVGGLAAATRLQRAGFAVTVLEKNGQVGGRLDRREQQGYRWDTGPTLLLMSDVYREFFANAGRRIEDYLTLRRVDPNYRVRFGDGTVLDMTSRSRRAVGECRAYRTRRYPRPAALPRGRIAQVQAWPRVVR